MHPLRGNSHTYARLLSFVHLLSFPLQSISTTPEASSGVAPIAVDDKGQNSIIICNGANDHLTEDDVAAADELIAKAKVRAERARWSLWRPIITERERTKASDLSCTPLVFCGTVYNGIIVGISIAYHRTLAPLFCSTGCRSWLHRTRSSPPHPWPPFAPPRNMA